MPLSAGSIILQKYIQTIQEAGYTGSLQASTIWEVFLELMVPKVKYKI